MRLFMSIGLLGLGIATGCHDDNDHVRETVVVRDQQPQPVVQDVQYEYDDTPIVVQQAPPPVVIETVPVSRGPDYIWRPGYQRYSNNRFVWVNGSYIHRRPGYTYVQPEWHHGYRGYEFRPGGWRSDGRHDNRGNHNDNRHDDRHDNHHNDHH